MTRAAFLFRVIERSVWSVVTGALSIGGALTFLRDEFLSSGWKDTLKLNSWLPDWPWHWWAIATLASAIVALLEGSFREYRDLQRQLSRSNTTRELGTYPETDGEQVLQYLATESAWAWREYARLNRWDFVNAPAELRRAAVNDEVWISGERPNTGEQILLPIPYWRHCTISPLTETRRGLYSSVGEKAQWYGWTNCHHLRVSADYENVWPRASWTLRMRAWLWVRLKLIYYANTREAWAIRRHEWNTIRDNVRDRPRRQG